MSPTPEHPGLGDLIDLEYQLESMPDADSDHYLEAARAVGQAKLASDDDSLTEKRQQIASDRGLRWQLCLAWLTRLRRNTGQDGHLIPMPGMQVEAGLRFGGTLLSILGVVVGAGAASASLGYRGNAPINLWQFLAIFVVLQLLLWAATLLAVGTSWLRKTTWLSMSQRWLLHMANRRIAPQLLTRGRLYQESQRWLLVQLTQRFGVFFNIGVLLVFGWLVIFSELTFAWSTTPANFKPSMLTAIVGALALPWSWLLPSCAPGAEAVELTRWSRLDASFMTEDQAAAAQYASDWWAFLYLAVIFWGLLPRLGAWLWARRKFRLSLQRVPLNHAAFLDLYEQMLPTAIGTWQGPTPAQVQGQLLPRPGETGAATSAKPIAAADGQVDVVVWGGWQLPEDQVSKLAGSFGNGMRRQWACGGANQREDEEALKKMAGSTDAGVLLLVEAEESPDKRLVHYLRRLRSGMPKQTPIHLALVDWHGEQLHDVDARRLHLWRTFLATMTDPYLRIVSLP